MVITIYLNKDQLWKLLPLIPDPKGKKSDESIIILLTEVSHKYEFDAVNGIITEGPKFKVKLSVPEDTNSEEINKIWRELGVFSWAKT